jgi:1-deoxy-D-xylulose-5-phosphate reductoisomerase
MVRPERVTAERRVGGATAPTTLSVLGATGSIGESTLDLVGRSTDFEIVALTAQRNVARLAELARLHRARLAVIGDEAKYAELKERLAGTSIRTAAGEDALVDAGLEPAQCVMAAIVGAAGLRPTFAAASQGQRIALANKECLVSAGEVFLAEIARSGGNLIPVDSEHSAAFQALGETDPTAIERITITASGGPFRTWDMERMARATPEQALCHPNWSMGSKITIDSATMMNKGLEVIEAFHLFPVEADQIDVVVHPQSIVHCLVAMTDGSVLAQLAPPDMRTPISLALAWPARLPTPVERLDLVKLKSLDFEAPDEVRFPALRLVREVLAQGGAAPAVFNAANEVAVAAFLDGRIGFLDIAGVVEQTLETAVGQGISRPTDTLDDVLNCDREARVVAHSAIGHRCR